METSVQSPILKPEERELLAELLEAEQRKLLLEIRHTATRGFRDQLSRRMELVEKTAEKIRLNPE
jgi:hypothetical protein